MRNINKFSTDNLNVINYYWLNFCAQNSQDWRDFLSLENFRTGNTSIIYYGCQYIIGTSYF